MNIRNPFNWNLRFGSIPSEFKEAMTYEEQIIWLYSQIKQLKEGSANYNYDLLENKPSIDGVVLSGNVTKTQLGIEQNYNILANKPSINSISLVGNLSLNDLGIQGKLVAGSGIRITGNTISATGGGSGGTSDYEELENLPSINGHELFGDKTGLALELQDSLAVNYHNQAQLNKYFNMSNIQIGDTISTPIQLIESSRYDCIVIENKFNGMHFDLYGIYQVLITNSNNEVTTIFETGETAEHGFIDISTDGGYIIIDFVKDEAYSCYLKFTNDYLKAIINPKKIYSNIILGTSRLNLETGFYNTLNYNVYWNENITADLICGNNEIFYFDSFNQLLITNFEYFIFDSTSNEWGTRQNSYIINNLENNEFKVPTAHAVYQALQNIQPSVDLFYTKLSASLDLNLDGSVTSNGNTLTTGYYLTSYGVDIDGGSVDLNMANCILYYDSNSTTLMKAVRNSNYEVEYFYYYTNEWNKINRDVNTEIPASGQNNNIPTNLAVRNYVNDKVTASTSDITAGTTPLASGNIYLVYEP